MTADLEVFDAELVEDGTVVRPGSAEHGLRYLVTQHPMPGNRDRWSVAWACRLPVGTGTEAGSLALAMPLADAHRLKHATHTLARKAVPVLLPLLISGGITP